MRRDQESRAAVSVSERQVSETGSVSVTGETVEQTEQETSENPLPEQRRIAAVTATTPTTAAPHCHTHTYTHSACQDNLDPTTMFTANQSKTLFGKINEKVKDVRSSDYLLIIPCF